MADNISRRVLKSPSLKWSVALFNLSRVKPIIGPVFVVLSNGNIGLGRTKLSFGAKSIKIKHEITNEQIAKIETATTPAGKPETTIKIVDTSGRTDIFRIIQLISLRKDIAAAQLPPLLSTIYADRYSKL